MNFNPQNTLLMNSFCVFGHDLHSNCYPFVRIRGVWKSTPLKAILTKCEQQPGPIHLVAQFGMKAR